MSIVRQDFRSKLSGEKGESMNTVLEKIKKMKKTVDFCPGI